MKHCKSRRQSKQKCWGLNIARGQRSPLWLRKIPQCSPKFTFFSQRWDPPQPPRSPFKLKKKNELCVYSPNSLTPRLWGNCWLLISDTAAFINLDCVAAFGRVISNFSLFWWDRLILFSGFSSGLIEIWCSAKSKLFFFTVRKRFFNQIPKQSQFCFY